MIGQALQLETQRGCQIVGRAGSVYLEEIGFAFQTIDNRTLRCIVGVEGGRDRLYPGKLAPVVHGHQIVGVD
ncbi:MAG TPA: hypothetical protein VII92_03830, partial [Anaerolineae bacterium]